jgi:hypothetical protein
VNAYEPVTLQARVRVRTGRQGNADGDGDANSPSQRARLIRYYTAGQRRLCGDGGICNSAAFFGGKRP